MTDNEKLFLYQAIEQADKWHARYRSALSLGRRNQDRIDEVYRNWRDAEENISDLLYHIKT